MKNHEVTLPNEIEHGNATSEGPGPLRTRDSDPTLASTPHMLAAVDLGSNSFRMVIARRMGNELRPVDRLREGVRLAECLDERQRLSDIGIRRALDCLHKFGQRVRELPPGAVRAVGTNTLRRARDKVGFMRQAEKALGHPIEVISGQEEARLIYLGASHSLAGAKDQRLVVDIGGGSTECVVGEGFEPLRAESLYMGCVGYTMAHFPGGRISRGRMRRAEMAARLELRPVKADFRKLGWQRAVGASGTVQAIAEILRLEGWCEQGISLEGLDKLHLALLDCRHVDEIRLEGLRSDRAKVLPGGLAILRAVFDSLRIDSMSVSQGALREGVLYDLLGRIRHEDARDRTIQRFVAQYDVDIEQAGRVERTALSLFDQAAKSWKLDPKQGRAFIRWAAKLHEVGLSIAHGGYHKHGAYLVEQSDMPGFSNPDQGLLALLVRGMRRKIPTHLFAELPKRRARFALRLCLLLRLGAVLNRSRSRRPMPEVSLECHKHRMVLHFPDGWLDEHPLTRADLAQESLYLRDTGHRLKVRPRVVAP